MGRPSRLCDPGRPRARADRPDRRGGPVSGWALLLAGGLFGAEAVRAHRRDPRPGRRRPRRPVLMAMAAIGRRPASRLPARFTRPPDPAIVRRAGVEIAPAEVVAARATSAACFAG